MTTRRRFMPLWESPTEKEPPRARMLWEHLVTWGLDRVPPHFRWSRLERNAAAGLIPGRLFRPDVAALAANPATGNRLQIR